VADAHPRLEELRRRLREDPASIVFAQLAEEHRRAGNHDEAIRVCRAGLEQHPFYVSARVTLGRALMAAERYDEALDEFEEALTSAPDNLIALKGREEAREKRALPILEKWLAAIQSNR
jgi:tetratricopeptide (TPR) repeat protein